MALMFVQYTVSLSIFRKISFFLKYFFVDLLKNSQKYSDGIFFSVTSRNLDSSIMNEPHAWRVLGMLPILKYSSTLHLSDEKRAERRLRLFHYCIGILSDRLDQICSVDNNFLYADGVVRRTRPFFHFLIMDGLEISVNALCPIDTCPSCWCPKQELDNTQVNNKGNVYSFINLDISNFYEFRFFRNFQLFKKFDFFKQQIS
jgi:hypothetical protein